MSTSIPERNRRPRATTIIWGALILAVAVLLLLGQFFALSIDPVVVALGLLIGVGLALVAGGILSLRTAAPETTRDAGQGLEQGAEQGAERATEQGSRTDDRDHGQDAAAY